jgi:CBS domain-containing membrane protein
MFRSVETDHGADTRRGWHIFRPILPGATLGNRLLASLAAIVGIALTGLLSALITGVGPHLILLIPPMGASAVLVFAVPASPLAQPWPTIGGNVVSAAVGIMVAHVVHEPALAAGIAVGVAIAAMSLLRCLHPPGGAAALVAVFGGPAVASHGLLFPLVPTGLNALLLVATGIVFHKLMRANYPHRAAPSAPSAVTSDKPPLERTGFRPEDLDAALANLGEAFDVSREDLERLLREVETRALSSHYGELTCGDIMSRDVLSVDATDHPDHARSLLIERDIRILPVIQERRLLGTVGWAELSATSAATIRELASEPQTVEAGMPAIDVAQRLARGDIHALVVVNEDRAPIGIVTQTDLLAVLSAGVTGMKLNRQIETGR